MPRDARSTVPKIGRGGHTVGRVRAACASTNCDGCDEAGGDCRCCWHNPSTSWHDRIVPRKHTNLHPSLQDSHAAVTLLRYEDCDVSSKRKSPARLWWSISATGLSSGPCLRIRSPYWKASTPVGGLRPTQLAGGEVDAAEL